MEEANKANRIKKVMKLQLVKYMIEKRLYEPGRSRRVGKEENQLQKYSQSPLQSCPETCFDTRLLVNIDGRIS